jgi:L-amino acid N-acyltransferase YncA
VRIRNIEAGDAPHIARIFGRRLTHGVASFELAAPGENQMARRRDGVLADGYPQLVAEDTAGRLLGHTDASPDRTRPGRRAARRGDALLGARLARCEETGLRLCVAVIGDSGNAASIGLHARDGFAHAGLLPSVGRKHGRWLDSVLMTRALGAGATQPPATTSAR